MPRSDPAQKWWWPVGPYQGDRPSVFFFGGVGADPAWAASPLIPLVDDVDFGVWRMPGRGSRRTEPAPTRLQAVARDAASSIAALNPVRPVLLGHSYGGLVAFLTAAALEQMGYDVGRLVLVNSASPREWQLGTLYSRVRGGPTRYAERQVALAGRTGLLPVEFGSNATWRSDVERNMVVDFTMGFRLMRIPTLKTTSITDISTPDDRQLKITDPKRWESCTRAVFESFVTTGHHLFYRERPEVVITIVHNESRLAFADRD